MTILIRIKFNEPPPVLEGAKIEHYRSKTMPYLVSLILLIEYICTH